VGASTSEETTMPERDDTPESTEHDPIPEESQADEKLLDDLDPEEEEAAGVEGGARTTTARWGRM
jgi:hypothetical protein